MPIPLLWIAGTAAAGFIGGAWFGSDVGKVVKPAIVIGGGYYLYKEVIKRG